MRSNMFKFIMLIMTLVTLSLAESIAETNVLQSKPIEQGVKSSATDLKTSASERFFDVGSRFVPSSVYGAPPSTGFYSSTGYSGLGSSGFSSPGYTGYSGLGYSGFSPSLSYSGYQGSGLGGYSGYSGGYPSGYTRGYSGYSGNGGYGGYGGNGGLGTYSGYNNPYYSGQGNTGYGYYRNGLGLGSSIYSRGFGQTGHSGITPSYVTGYRGYS